MPDFDEHGRRIDRHKSLHVKIPAGVADGEHIRLKGQGAPGVNGGPHGDLYLTIRLVPHPLFDVDGRDLILTVPLAPWEVALGMRIEVPTLSGRINLSIPPDSQSGQRLRIRGKGLKGRQGEGDLYARAESGDAAAQRRARPPALGRAARSCGLRSAQSMEQASMNTILSVQLTLEECSLLVEAPTASLVEIVEYGIVEPSGGSPADWRFDNLALGRLRQALRLHRELQLDWQAVAVALDLLDEVGPRTRA